MVGISIQLQALQWLDLRTAMRLVILITYQEHLTELIFETMGLLIPGQ
jgi:hypothetical protein